MIQTTAALVAASLLCIAFDSTRKYGVLGAAIVIFLYPLPSSALLILGGAAYFIVRYHQRSNKP